MANLEIGNDVGFINVKRVNGLSAIEGAVNLVNAINYDTIGALRTRLAAINPTLYTPAYLETLSRNDMVYAVRIADDPTSLTG